MPQDPSGAAVPEKPLRLLVADDDPDDLELCLRVLRKSDILFEAETVSTRELFAQKLRENPVDVVLTDYRMKDWTGMDALAMVKEVCPGIPLILMSGTLGDDRAVESIKAGVTDYVLKDQLARLPMALRRAHEERLLKEAEAHALETLRLSEARYRSFVDNALYGIYWVSPEGRLLFANPALARMLAYDSTDELLALGDTKPLYCDPEVRDQVREQFFRHSRVDATADWERKDGKVIHVRINGHEVSRPEDESRCIEVIVEDITDRQRLERQLVQAQKFEAIGQLAGGIAHDFNNMIGAILGWAEMGVEETETESRLHRHFEKIHQQGKRAALLTRQLLAFARRQILEPRSMDLNHTVIETLNLLEKVLGSNIEIRANLAPDLSIVRADPTQVEQVLMNLCINARDAMPKGGSLIIDTSNVTLDEPFCASQPLARPGVYAVLAVTDSGIGMDQATQDRIFEPFFTTKEFGKGTGLGLATVWGIVRQHNGFLHVYSEVERGSTFRVYLPAVTTGAEVLPTADAAPQPVRGGTETILVAEDHEGLRHLAHETLSSLGYQVILAADGEQAVAEFRAHSASISLALLDVVMPRLGGPEVHDRICDERPDLPTIFVTGYSAEIDLLQKARAKGVLILQKPYAPHDLARRIREQLDRRAASQVVPAVLTPER